MGVEEVCLPVLNADSRYDDLQENAIYIEGEE